MNVFFCLAAGSRSHCHTALLEVLDIHVAGGSHGSPQSADKIQTAIGAIAGSKKYALQAPHLADLDPATPRQLRMMGLGSPVHALAGSIGSLSQRRAQHDRVGPHGYGHLGCG